jgi:hypothetical protein
MKRQSEMIEGPEAFKRFKNLMKTVIAVPHSEIQKRVEQQRAKAAKNAHRRGPKRKHAKASASHATGASSKG